jgi:hypothetical protein
MTAAYDFRQIPADRARAQNEIEIGELFCGRLLNLRSHSTQAYEMRPAHHYDRRTGAPREPSMENKNRRQ